MRKYRVFLLVKKIFPIILLSQAPNALEEFKEFPMIWFPFNVKRLCDPVPII